MVYNSGVSGRASQLPESPSVHETASDLQRFHKVTIGEISEPFMT